MKKKLKLMKKSQKEVVVQEEEGVSSLMKFGLEVEEVEGD
jgi:hypothetical protein